MHPRSQSCYLQHLEQLLRFFCAQQPQPSACIHNSVVAPWTFTISQIGATKRANAKRKIQRFKLITGKNGDVLHPVFSKQPLGRLLGSVEIRGTRPLPFHSALPLPVVFHFFAFFSHSCYTHMSLFKLATSRLSLNQVNTLISSQIV